MTVPTYYDAALLVQLAQWRSLSGTDDALNWMWSEEFNADYAAFVQKYPPGSEGSAKASKIGAWYETVGTLYKHGLLNEALLFDWLAVGLVWERFKDIVLETRKQTGDAKMYENFEALAKAEKEWSSH